MSANPLRGASCLLFLSVVMGFAAANAPARAQETSPSPGNETSREAAGPLAQNGAEDKPAKQSAIQVENWSRPQSGWLYVLDPNPGDAAGRVWLIDPHTGKVMGAVLTSASPDFALSPDGSRLYVASSTGNDSNELAVIDTAQGVILKSGRVDGREAYDGLPPFSTMAVSGDGLALRVLIDAPKSDDQDAFLLATFDTQAGEFLTGVVHLGNCGPGRFISYLAADHFDFLCPRTNRVRLIRVDADSRAVQNQDVELPWERRIGVAEAFESADSDAMTIVVGNGAVVSMSVATRQFFETRVHQEVPNRVPPAAWPTSPDGSRVYLGYKQDYDKADNRFYLDYGRPPNSRPSSELADRFRVYDTNTWAKVGTIRTKMQFWSAVVSTDGKTLYATAPHKHSILVIDTVKRQQTGVLKVGGAPSLLLVAP